MRMHLDNRKQKGGPSCHDTQMSGAQHKALQHPHELKQQRARWLILPSSGGSLKGWPLK